MLGFGLVRAADGDKLHLIELMLADVAARVLARRAGLGAEAGGQRGHADRQIGFAQDLVAHRIGQRNLGRGDQPAAVGGPEQVLGKLGELPGAEHRLVADQQRRRAFDIAVFGGLHIQHELRDRPLQPCHLPAQEGEARTRNLGSRLEIEAKRGAEVGMLLGREGELARGAPARDFDIARLVLAFRHLGGGQVGQAGKRVLQARGQLALFLFQRGQGLLQACDFRLERLGLLRCAATHRRADRLGGLVTAVLRLLHPRGYGAALRIEFEDRRR